VRHDSPAVLATAGTLAIHLMLAVLGDALVVTFPAPRYVPAPRVELVDIEPPPVLQPPPPPMPEPAKPAAAEPPPRPIAEPRPQRVQPKAPPPAEEPPPPTANPEPSDSGGAPVTSMENIAPSATGVAVARGPRNTGRIGRGGTGTGTGAGSGSGSADEPPRPVSVATIKTRALPKGDFSYFDASKDYPPEAKTLGIEGVIRVRLVVDDSGKVASTVLLNKLGHGLDELALARAKSIEFTPAMDSDGKPVSSVVVWTFNMTLPK
jgi:TonB family protein